MCDEMWEEHTEEIFQSVTIEQALQTPSTKWRGISSFVRSQVKLWEQSIFCHIMNKYRYDVKSKGNKLKFRRYSVYKKKMVRNVNTETELTLGYSRTFGRSVSRSLSGFGDGNFYYLEEG